MISDGIKNAYALLGLSFIIVFGGAYFLFSQSAQAPTVEDTISKKSMSLTLISPAFVENGHIPPKYTCDGENINPLLQISGVPEGTKSLVLVMDDPDIPEAIKSAQGIEKFNHWALYNIPADTKEIPENSALGMVALNTRGQAAYAGPCPPTEYEPTEHRYVFRLYALSDTLNFSTTPTLDEVEQAAQGIMLEQAELVGRYTRVTEEG